MTRTLALLLALALPSVAVAQADPEAEHRRGMALRVEGRHAEAAEVFRAVYERTREPRALARQGLAEAAAGNWEAAGYHLRAALAYDADPWILDHRADLTRDLALVDTHAPAAPVAVPAPAPAMRRVPVVVAVHPVARTPHPAPDRTRTILGITGLALGGVGLAVGVGALVARNDAADTFNAPRGGHNCSVVGGSVVAPPGLDCEGPYGTATTMQTVSVVGFVGGGLFAAAGAVLLVTAPRRAEGIALRCGFGPGDVGVSCTGVF